AEQLGELAEDPKHRRAGLGLALDVDSSPASQRSPGQLEGLERLLAQLPDPNRLATVAMEATLSQFEQPSLSEADLLLALPRDHAEPLGEIVGDAVGRQRDRFEQLGLQQPRYSREALGPDLLGHDRLALTSR